MKDQIFGIAHCSHVVSDTARSVEFYTQIVGLKLDPNRPALSFPGAWLQIGPDSLHLLQVPNVDPVDKRPAHGGRDRHLAINVDDLAPILARLEAASIDYSRSQSGRPAVFFRDPDGNTLEIIGQRDSSQHPE